MDAVQAIWHWRGIYDYELPRDLYDDSNGRYGVDSELDWNNLTWGSSDDPASVVAKPTWTVLVAAYVKWLASLMLENLQNECRRRIIVGYGETDFKDEVSLRLRNAHTTDQDTERDRLRAKYQVLKAQIEGATTEAALVSIALDADETWQ